MRRCGEHLAERLAGETLPFMMSNLDRRTLLNFAEQTLNIGGELAGVRRRS
jgi:hypothetical protein